MHLQDFPETNLDLRAGEFLCSSKGCEPCFWLPLHATILISHIFAFRYLFLLQIFDVRLFTHMPYTPLHE